MTLVFFLEERSAREMLTGLLPRVLPAHVAVRYVVFEGKHDLDQNIGRRLRGWLTPHTAFIVLRDQDSEECVAVKRGLLDKCEAAGKKDAVVRIACRELESWYFGDLRAVEQALGVAGLTRHQGRRAYRVPDDIRAPARELAKITRNSYQKVAGSRAIGRRLSLTSNTSRSFRVFLAAVQRFAAAS